MGKCSSPYPQLVVGGSGSGVVSQAGAALLLRTAESVGLITALSRVLSPWRKPLAAHIIGLQASTLIQPVIQAMSFGLDARSMARGQYWIHPAMPELIENALLNLPLD